MAEETEKRIELMRTLHTHHVLSAGGSTSYQVASSDMALLLTTLETLRADLRSTAEEYAIADMLKDDYKAEIETLRAERDALLRERSDYRAALTDIRDIAQLNLDTTVDRFAMENIQRIAATLIAHPAPQVEAEWTPRAGRHVKVKATGERGVVFAKFDEPEIYRVEFTNGEYADYERDELVKWD